MKKQFFRLLCRVGFHQREKFNDQIDSCIHCYDSKWNKQYMKWFEGLSPAEKHAEYFPDHLDGR